jgi:hypothetical protein
MKGASMRTAIGLTGLGVIGGVAPTGLAGIPYVALVLGSTCGALLLLVAGCVVGASLARPSSPAVPARRLPLRHATPTGSASRSI